MKNDTNKDILHSYSGVVVVIYSMTNQIVHPKYQQRQFYMLTIDSEDHFETKRLGDQTSYESEHFL